VNDKAGKHDEGERVELRELVADNAFLVKRPEGERVFAVVFRLERQRADIGFGEDRGQFGCLGEFDRRSASYSNLRSNNSPKRLGGSTETGG